MNGFGGQASGGYAPGRGAARLNGLFIAALILAYVLARVLGLVGARTVGSGLEMGFWIWLGFVATTSSGDYLFGGRPTPLYGALLAVWQ